ncbi:winged helix DNA-binding domain-containing protein [Nocardia stercoris]|uniref:Winged helix DNA-binding domain-containing protein n=1 Tax=Nocardia stercoris TaxID=2483361 RepID=A0A3M2L5H9_9NOCA|nr:winged helix DNA-binding domain-containing protein [Nocardia stercoris]RMI29798.1 winged helix DNA-binding domain-containing protein [Nocardia stercoris]
MRSMDRVERQRRLVRRQLLAPELRAKDVVGVAESVVVLHATDPATVYLAVAARSSGLSPADVERALYEERELVRMLAMRRTMFVAPAGLVPVLQAAVGDELAAKQRRNYARYLADVVDGDAVAWLAEVEAETHSALLELGTATGAQLAAAVPRLRTQVDTAPGKPYSKPTAITSWVLLLLGAAGHIVRGRPNGGWTSSQYTWAPMETWLPHSNTETTAAEARTDLVRRWLRTFGPAPLSDLVWWTGWSQATVRKALAPLAIAEVNLDGEPGLVLADDLDAEAPSAPAAALLPALDPTPMGWKTRDWFLGPHAGALFDRTGNIGPTVWWDGRVVGGWAQRADGEIVWRLLEDVGAEAEQAVTTEAARMTAWYGDIRAIPRFRTPLERELTA